MSENLQDEINTAKQDDSQKNNESKVSNEITNEDTNEIVKEESLEEKISKLEKIIEDLNKKLLIKTADIENLRKRHKEEIDKSNKYAISNFASDMTVISEQLFLAEENMPKKEISQNAKIQNFADAIIMTKNELLKTLKKHQISRIYPLGEKFDHNIHEAISRIPDDGEENIVKQVIQAGYKISNRLIKSALVAVSVKK
jgi:molecular chaperone GrpE